jgi:hypothetical protein
MRGELGSATECEAVDRSDRRNFCLCDRVERRGDLAAMGEALVRFHLSTLFEVSAAAEMTSRSGDYEHPRLAIHAGHCDSVGELLDGLAAKGVAPVWPG